MKNLFLSLLVSSPLLLQAERASEEFEAIFLDEAECILENLDEELSSVSHETTSSETQSSERISYQNSDDASSKRSFSDSNQLDQMQNSKKGSKEQWVMHRDCWPPKDRHWVIGAEFLWWKLDQGYLDYALLNKSGNYFMDITPPPPGKRTASLFGKMKRLDFDWRPGFRVNLGYEFETTPWMVNGEYTGYETSDKDKVDLRNLSRAQVAKEPLLLTHDNVLSFTPVFAASKAKFHYNVANVTFQRSLELAKKFSMTPLFGIQGAWIDQTTKVHYMTVLPPQNGPFQIDNFIKNHWDFSGGGLLAGIRTDCCLASGFSLYSTVDAGALYGSYHHNIVAESVPPQPLSPTDEYSDMHVQHMRTVINFQINAGAAWSRDFKSMAIRGFIGWEFNLWNNLSEIFTGVVSDTDDDEQLLLQKNDLNLQGLTLGLELRF